MPRKRTVLCVDGYQVLLNTLQAMLPKVGYEILVATNPGDAIALAYDHEVDLILLDFHLCPACGNPDELCLAERLRRIRPEARTLVWAAEASSMTQRPPCAMDVLIKPVDPAVLAARLNKLLPRDPG